MYICIYLNIISERREKKLFFYIFVLYMKDFESMKLWNKLFLRKDRNKKYIYICFKLLYLNNIFIIFLVFLLILFLSVKRLFEIIIKLFICFVF